MAATDFSTLREEYDAFLRQEVCINIKLSAYKVVCMVNFTCLTYYIFCVCTILRLPQRFNYVDRISTSIDDYAHRSKSLSVEGWGCPRVDISMADLRSQDNGILSQRLRRDPLPHMRALEAACHDIASESRPGYDKHGRLEMKQHTTLR
jgi:hypothetical protein